jgi:alpha-tubulin suppressor-like RCC1 family protein
MFIAPSQVSAASVPHEMESGDGFISILDTAGQVWTWGGVGPATGGYYVGPTPMMVRGLSAIQDIEVGSDFVLALDIEGNVWAWGENYNGQLGTGDYDERFAPVKVQSGIKDIAAGAYHALAVTAVDGKVLAWGINSDGQLGNGTTACTRTANSLAGCRR